MHGRERTAERDARGGRSGGRRRRKPIGGAALVALLTLGASLAGAEARHEVTPASGPSLVSRTATGVDWSSFGRAGSSGAADAPASPADWLGRGFELGGDDLYRLNCRACHGPAAAGSRSGVPPLHGALQPRAAGEGAAAAAPGAPGAMAPELEVRHRLLAGGRVMPPFGHLDPEEVALLLGYLRGLAPGAAKPPATELGRSAARVGEHVVKAVCQICHDATAGAERPPLDRQVITLADIPEKFAVRDLVRKIRSGAAHTGDARGRMPTFDYFSDAELEAAYVYLTAYPPRAEPKAP